MKIRFPDVGDIINQVLIIDKTCFTKPMLHYDRVFYQKEKKITQEYVNGELSCYYEEEFQENFRILRGFSSEKTLFSTEVTYLNPENKAYMNYSGVKTINGNLEVCYRRINGKGQFFLPSI
jgi:hypothetical protein